MKNQEYRDLMEKLFDAKLAPIKEDITIIKIAIYGNGREGLRDRVDSLEDTQKNIMAKFGGFTVFFSLVFVAIFEVCRDFLKTRFGL